MKKRGSMKKQGLSPAIATVLLVVLVLVLAALIFLWARGLISEQIEKSGQSIDNVCSTVNFDANVNGNNLEVVNRGTVAINSFDVKKIIGGDSVNIPIPDSAADVGESFSIDISAHLSGDPEKVVIYPVLLGNVRGGKQNKHYTCKEMGKTITL